MRKPYLILIKTKDKRNIFTTKENLTILGEFVKTFGVKVFQVKSKEASVINEIKELAKSFCSTLYNDGANFEIVRELKIK